MKITSWNTTITSKFNRVLLLVAELIQQLCLLIYKFRFITVIDAIATLDDCIYDG